MSIYLVAYIQQWLVLNDICKHRGSILFISSVAGIIGLPNYSQYSATKRAVISLAESLKSELIDYGVFVGINYPGFTENEEHKTIINSEERSTSE